MTDKQNHFTYTDNTSDNNDKIMENLHKQIINITIDDLINGNLRDMEFTAQFGVYRQAVKSLAEQLKAKNEELNNYIKHLHNLCGNETDKQYKYKQALTEIKEIAEEKANVNDWLALEILQKCEVLDDSSN